MRSFPALRLGSHVFFFAAVLSFFAPFCRDLRSFWLLAGLALAAALAAERVSRPPLRFALALLPGAALLLPVSGWVSFAAAAALWGYAAVVIFRGRFCPEPVAYRRSCVWLLFAIAFLTLVAFLWTESDVSTVWLLLCAALLVLLALQMLQNSGSMGPAWQAGSIGMLAAVLGLAVLAGLLLYSNLRLLLTPFIWFAEGFGYLIALLLRLITRIRYKVLEAFGTDDHALDENIPELSFNTGGNPKPSSQLRTEADLKPLELNFAPEKLLAVLAFLVLLFLAIRFLRNGGASRLRRKLTQTANGLAVPERRARKKEKALRRPTDNREAIRLLYTRYLEYLHTRGVRVDASDTTAEVTEASAGLFVQPDELLRGLYRKARYSSEAISDEDLRTAQERFEALLSVDNLRRNDGTG